MSDISAPERIWATEDAANYGEDRFHSTKPMRGLTEYIRADLHQAALDRAEVVEFPDRKAMQSRITGQRATIRRLQSERDTFEKLYSREFARRTCAEADKAAAVQALGEIVRQFGDTPNGHMAVVIAKRALTALPTPAPMTVARAARDVLAERARQISAEGWTPEHDDTHGSGEMAGAALCYLASDIPHWARDQAIASFWPWSKDWWKPSEHRRNLIKAGALILAEIERLDRAALTEPRT